LINLIETLAKHMIILKDSTFSEILEFLDICDQCGKSIQTVINPLDAQSDKNTVSYEARLVKRMFLKIISEWSMFIFYNNIILHYQNQEYQDYLTIT